MVATGGAGGAHDLVVFVADLVGHGARPMNGGEARMLIYSNCVLAAATIEAAASAPSATWQWQKMALTNETVIGRANALYAKVLEIGIEYSRGVMDDIAEQMR